MAKSLVVTSPIINKEEKRHFKIECSHYIISNKRTLIDLKLINIDKVIFGNGEKGEVLVVGNLKVPGMPRLEDFFLVDELKANQIASVNRKIRILK